MRKASPGDIDTLVALMVEFYGESGYPLNKHRAAQAFLSLVADEWLGCVWLIESDTESDAEDVGYMVVTLGYSMEYGGRDAFIDDLFIRSEYRGRGLGKAAMPEARAYCLSQGVRAIHLEVGRDNARAQAVYRKAGFVDTDRQLLTLRLADPTHIG